MNRCCCRRGGRYTGTFYAYAADALAEAAQHSAAVLILSGGYGVLEVTAQIGWYERRLHPADWPTGLLGRLIADHARRREMRRIVAFMARESPYAHVLPATDWAHLGIEQVVLVTADSAGRGTQVSVPRDLGLGFASWYQGRLGSAPDTLRTESLVAGAPSDAAPAPVFGRADAAAAPLDVSGRADAEHALVHLADRTRAVPAQALNPREPMLQHPGLYSWWADEEVLDLLRRCLGEDIGPLIYAGQVGATARPLVVVRATTLQSRIIGEHLRGQTRGWAFALSLAATLREPLGLRFTAPRKIDTPGRHALSLWMRIHLAVATYPVPSPAHIAQMEENVLHVLDPPLNLRGRATTPVRARLSVLRRATGAAA